VKIPFRRETATLSPELEEALQQANKQHRELIEEIKKQHLPPAGSVRRWLMGLWVVGGGGL